MPKFQFFYNNVPVIRKNRSPYQLALKGVDEPAKDIASSTKDVFVCSRIDEKRMATAKYW
jgi:hypothetical protein